MGLDGEKLGWATFWGILAYYNFIYLDYFWLAVFAGACVYCLFTSYTPSRSPRSRDEDSNSRAAETGRDRGDGGDTSGALLKVTYATSASDEGRSRHSDKYERRRGKE